jgi:hypothetical protein
MRPSCETGGKKRQAEQGRSGGRKAYAPPELVVCGDFRKRTLGHGTLLTDKGSNQMFSI